MLNFVACLVFLLSSSGNTTQEIYIGSGHNLSVYKVFEEVTPVHYIFRDARRGSNNNIQQHVLAYDYFYYTIDSDVHISSVYLGTFFNTSFYRQYTYGNSNGYLFQWISHLGERSDPNARVGTTVTPYNATRPPRIATSINNTFDDSNINNFIHSNLYTIVIIIVISIIVLSVAMKAINSFVCSVKRKVNAKRSKDNWSEKYAKIKENAEQARIERGWKPDKYN